MGKTKTFQNLKLLGRMYSKPEDRDGLYTLCYLIHSQKIGKRVLLKCILKACKSLWVLGEEVYVLSGVLVFFSIHGKKKS